MRKPVIVKASISDTIEILGHKVAGYKAILDAMEKFLTPGIILKNREGEERVFSEPHIYDEEPVLCIPGLHVIEVYEKAPCFDSYDYAYEKPIRYFYFSDKPFTQDRINKIAFMKRCGSQTYDQDEMPEWALPSAYYCGTGDEIIYAF